MRRPQRDERGIVLIITLMFALIAAIGAAAFLHLSKTQILEVKLQSHSTKAFYAAETGLEKGIKLLKEDFYYTPQGTEPSWADNKIYTATGYIQLQIQKYLNPNNPHYDDEFYPLLDEADYNVEANGRYKSTYKVDLSNVLGWKDRIWVKATGRYYRRDEQGTGFVLEAKRAVLALVRAVEISPWNNAIFAGEGQAGRVVNGNVDVRGSVHLLGTSLGSNDLAAEFGGSGNVGNNYSGIPSELALRIPPIQKSYGIEILDSLEAEVRVQHGKFGLSGTSCLGQPNVPGNSVKEMLEGVYITDGYAGNQGESNVFSDNGSKNPYDLGEFDLTFPRLSAPYKGFSSYLNYLRANALVISDAQGLNQLGNIVPTSLFSYSNDKGQISMDGSGHLTVRGIVVVEGDVNVDRIGSDKTIQYEGKGLVCSAKNVSVNCNVLTRSFSTYPKVDLLGIMAANEVSFNFAGINVMGVFYAENKIVSQKQTSVAGTFFSNYFDMGQNVPSVYQVPDAVRNLPAGMIGDIRVWTVKRVTWGEI